MAMEAVMQSEHFVGILMRTCWTHELVVSWRQLWGVCKLWCDVWEENDQAWVTYFLNRQNFRIHWGLERERRQDAVIVRLRRKKLKVEQENEVLEDMNETLRQQVWDLKREVRDVERLRRQVDKLHEKLEERKVKLNDTEVYLQDANKTVFELLAKNRKRDIEGSRVVGEPRLKAGRPALGGAAE